MSSLTETPHSESITTKKHAGLRVIVVAGASGAGKSTLIDQLLAGQMPEMAGAVGIDLSESWEKLGVWRLTGVPGHAAAQTNRVILHYDFLCYPHTHRLKKWLTQFDRSAQPCGGDTDLATDAVMLTLWTPPSILRDRLKQRGEGLTILTQHPRGFLKRFWRRRHVRRAHRFYRDPERVILLFLHWNVQVERMGITAHHLITINNGEVSWHRPDELRELIHRGILSL